ncbi:MAG: serine hydrolase domain-containing protein [Ilumatobacteraceae bacterium]
MSAISRDQVADACRYFDRWVAFRCASSRVPGAQTAVLFDDEVVLAGAYGVSDIDAGDAMTARHLFRIASHSKTFTATAIMQLCEQGALRLDDTVGQRLPELEASPIAAVTIRELLSHGGGIVRDGWDGDFWQLSRSFPDREELLRVAADTSDVLPRNERLKYSNVGYSLLGLMIEAVSGQSYGAYVTEHIVDRLGLTDIGPEYVEQRAGEYAGGHTALSYADARRPIDHIDTHAMAAATGFYATATDLVRYMSAHFVGDERLLTEASKRQMQRVEWNVEGVDGSYGLGFAIDTIGKRRVFGHGGGYPGHITRTFFDPVDRLAVSALTNAIDGPALGWATAAFKLIDLAGRGDAGDAEPDASIAHDRFCGRFSTLWGVYDVVSLGGRLYQLDPSQLDPTAAVTELSVIDDHTLRIERSGGYGSPGERLSYTFTADGTVESVRGGSGNLAAPIDTFRRAVDATDRVSLGHPVWP